MVSIKLETANPVRSFKGRGTKRRIQAVIATLLVNDYNAEPSEYSSSASCDDPPRRAGRADRGM
ncbi:hypothetical protein [Winogradskya humida]|uniref:Uncharacterized protein n=1 Tax=Winogradskya humida TaxID=113566 RepID=A0ABQ4A288_9ACTN|nr:hypothetical protein [Actinoplanes humidus]GIE24958.1 hypothetical protein Ahu01nite_080600 [Actinoplanes humidus]